jgi:2-oxoglutarate dehydrogenase E1 component
VLDNSAAKSSGVDMEHLRDIGLKISTLPKDQVFHKQIKKIFDARVKSYETGQNIDWGSAEALACATLVEDGYNVRISG